MDRVLRRALFVLLCVPAFGQQTLILNSGTRIPGRYDGGKADTVSFIDEHGNRHTFRIDEIQSLVFNTAMPTGAGISERYAPDANPTSYEERGYADTDVAPSAGWTRRAVIPPGAEIIVRTIDPIDVRRPDPRRHYLATIERDVLDANGNVVIPRGSMAHLIVSDVGDGEIAVDLRSVSAKGQRYIINSENFIETGVGANRRTGKYAGGGALLGTIIGAIAAGAKGAALGAIAGGAAGAGTQVLTRGPAIHIPTETVLTFRLDHPVFLYD